MTLARVEWKRLIEDYRMHAWPGFTWPIADIVEVCVGHEEQTVVAVLDRWVDRGVPPTVRDMASDLENAVTPSPPAAVSIAEARARIAEARANVDQRNRQLRGAS